MRFITRLLLLVIVAATPIIGVEVYTVLELRRHREAEIREAARTHAQAVAAEVAQMIQGVKQLLVAISLAPPVRDRQPDACDDYLVRVKERFAPDLVLDVLDRTGESVCRSDPAAAPRAVNVDRYYFSEAMRSMGFVVGDYASGHAPGQRALHLAYPSISDGGQPTGVVVAPIDLGWFAGYVARHRLPPLSVVTIADRNGRILVRLPDRERVGETLPERWTPLREANESGIVDWRSVPDDIRRIVGYAPVHIGSSRLLVAVGLSYDMAIAEMRRTVERSSYVVALALLLGVLAARLLAYYALERPVRRLDRAGRRWASGDYRGRIAPSGTSELDSLARTLDEMAATLEKREAERARAEEELRRSRDEALQASVAKSRFLAAASHELRQPLQSMSVTVAVLEMRHKNDGDAPVVARLDRAVTNLVELLNTLLDISQLEAGLVNPNVRTFNVAGLLTDLAQEFADIAEAKGIDFELQPCQFSIRSDPGLLGRMLRSLIDNAIKFTPSAGRVEVACHDHGSQLLIVVQDTGVGIPEDRRSEIFRDFQRLENAQRDRPKGPGLGLAIVDRLSRLLQHPVSVHSSPGRGATFTVTVPKALDDAGGVEEAQAVPFAGRV